jgi:hypothetical protein
MSRRSSLTILAVLAASGALIAGCSSSSSSSTSTATSAAASPSATSAPMSPTAASPTASVSSTKISAADCKTLSTISAGVIPTLTPLQTEPTSKAAVALKAYVAKLTADEATLSSPKGKATLAAFVTALEKSQNETEAQATTTLTNAIGALSAACA